MAAYYDFFRKILLQPDGITLEADSTSDILTITGGNGVSLNPNVSNDSFTIDVDYQLYVPPGTTDIRLQDVKSAFTGVTLNPGSNIAITRNSNSELTITATVGAASKSITNITQASPAVLTTTNLHEFTEGSEVTITDVSGMTQVNGEEYFMDVLTGNTVALYTDELLTVPLNSTGFTAYASGGVATADYSSVRTLSELTDVNATSAVAEDILVYRGGIWIPSSNIVADMVGSVFSDDSSVLVDAVNSKHYGTFIGDLTGNVTGTVTSIANHTTTNLSEGTNLFYTDTRVDNRFDTRLATKSTSDLAEGTNLYYTDTRANTAIDTRVTNTFINNLTGVIADSVDGDLTGSVFADDSSIIIDGISKTIHGNLGSVTATESIKVHGGNPAVDFDVNGDGASSVQDALWYQKWVGGDSTTYANLLDTKSIEPNWDAITGTSNSHNKGQLRFLRGNTRDALLSSISSPAEGHGDSIILGNIDDDGSSMEFKSGLSISGNMIYLRAGGSNAAAIEIKQEASDGKIEIISQNTKFSALPTGFDFYGTINAQHEITGNLTGNVTGNLTGTMSGSVFGDDSSLLVDGINNKLVMANNTTDDLAEGSNNKYFTNGRAIAMTIVFG